MLRQDLLRRNGKPGAHREYYSQYVTEHIKRVVSDTIGLDKIKASTDKHLNDIPLEVWDKMTDRLPLRLITEQMAVPGEFPIGDYPTLSGLVCIAKEAARQLKET